jgi:predicted PurR-regulated permease PerM
MTDQGTAQETVSRRDQQEDPEGVVATVWSGGFGRFAMRSLQVLIVVAVALAGVWVVGLLRVVVIPVLLALLLSAAFAPLVGLLQRLHFSRGLAAGTALLLALLVLAGVVTLVVFRVAGQWRRLTSSASDGIGQIQQALSGPPLNLDTNSLTGFRQKLTEFVTSGSFGSGALAGVASALDIVTSALVLIVTLFLFLKDGPKIWEFLLRPLDSGRTARARRIGQAGLRSFGGYVRGTALVALVDAVFIGAGLFILQVPLALPLSIIVFITAFIPIVGATLAGTLAALVALVTNGFGAALWVVVIVVVVNQLEGNLLQPVITGHTVSLHPLVVLLALVIGSILAGIIGAIVAVPVTSVIWDAIKLWNAPGDDAPGAAKRVEG